MKNYSTYKDSAVEWIGEIPGHWNAIKIKFSTDGSDTSFIDGDWIESKHISEEGIRYITTGNIGTGKYKEQGNSFITEDTFKELNCTEIFEGDLVISRLFLPVGRSCIIPNIGYRIVTSVDNVVLRPHKKYLKEYLNYQFNSQEYSEYSSLQARGATLIRISRTMLGNNSIVVPPLTEQQQIVAFLDNKTEKIDDLISHKQKKIDLLKEKRTALINHVVTKGLNPDVELKDSGVEWIGEIPIHWGLKKLKHLVNENVSSLSSSTKPDYELDYIEISDVDSEGRISEPTHYKFSESPSRCRRIVNKGDVLISTVRTYLKSIGLIKDEVENLICSTGFSVLTPRDGVVPKYLFYLLRTEWFISMVISKSVGVSYPAIQSDKLVNIPVLGLSLKEQQQIVDYLDQQTKEIDDLVKLEEQKIELLKEYRQSLISEVVTGKVRVCEEDLFESEQTAQVL